MWCTTSVSEGDGHTSLKFYTEKKVRGIGNYRINSAVIVSVGKSSESSKQHIKEIGIGPHRMPSRKSIGTLHPYGFLNKNFKMHPCLSTIYNLKKALVWLILRNQAGPGRSRQVHTTLALPHLDLPYQKVDVCMRTTRGVFFLNCNLW